MVLIVDAADDAADTGLADMRGGEAAGRLATGGGGAGGGGAGRGNSAVFITAIEALDGFADAVEE